MYVCSTVSTEPPDTCTRVTSVVLNSKPSGASLAGAAPTIRRAYSAGVIERLAGAPVPPVMSRTEALLAKVACAFGDVNWAARPLLQSSSGRSVASSGLQRKSWPNVNETLDPFAEMPCAQYTPSTKGLVTSAVRPFVNPSCPNAVLYPPGEPVDAAVVEAEVSGSVMGFPDAEADAPAGSLMTSPGRMRWSAPSAQPFTPIKSLRVTLAREAMSTRVSPDTTVYWPAVASVTEDPTVFAEGESGSVDSSVVSGADPVGSLVNVVEVAESSSAHPANVPARLTAKTAMPTARRLEPNEGWGVNTVGKPVLSQLEANVRENGDLTNVKREIFNPPNPSDAQTKIDWVACLAFSCACPSGYEPLWSGQAARGLTDLWAECWF